LGTQNNTAIESLHPHATTLPSVSGKVVGNKRHRLSGDMEFAFKKLTESSKKIETLKLELQWEPIETTKSIAQSMIAMEERSQKKSRNQTLQLAQFLQLNSKLDILLMFKKIDKRFAFILCMNTKWNCCMEHEFQ
jgi:hypothetical protein